MHEDFYKFLLDKFPAVMKWKGPNEDPNSVFNKHMANLGSGGAAAPIQIEEIKVEEKKAPAKAGPVAKKAPVKKQPSKVLRGKTWECYDYGEEELVFKEDDVTIGHMFNFYSCVKTTIRIEGKTK